ncbi:hypothetical protein [Janthinobacterium sp.]|uniref:hypothetical protein n=1 Tax=Janthinobacterium sp. TaxID=1871054 RepID=UPI00293D5B21|nr:hypothetical protein [Janthinobacterium sp.]
MKQGRGGGRRSKKEEKRSGRAEDKATGTQAGPLIEHVNPYAMLTVEEVETSAVYLLSQDKKLSIEAEKRVRGGSIAEIGAAENNGRVPNLELEKGTEVQDEDERKPPAKVCTAPGEGVEESKDVESGPDLMSPPRIRAVRRSEVFDVEEAKIRKAKNPNATKGTVQELGEDESKQMAEADGKRPEESPEAVRGSVEMETSPPRRARFAEEFDEVNEEKRRTNQRKPLRKSAARYDLKLELPPTDPAHALEALKGVLLNVWTVLKETDKRLVIYPWCNNAESKHLAGLKKVEDFPATLPGIREYFNGAFPKKQGGVDTEYFSQAGMPKGVVHHPAR